MPESDLNLDARATESASPKPPGRTGLDALAPGQPGYSEYCFGRDALLDAAALAQSREGIVSAALLYRAAAVLFLKAHERRQTLAPSNSATSNSATSNSATSNSATSSAPGWLDLPAASAFFEPLDSERRQRLLDVLRPDGEATLATLGTSGLEPLMLPLRRLALELAEPLEQQADAVRRRRTARWLRRALSGTALVLAITWAMFAIFGRRNLARDATVSASSAEPSVRANPRALVDGDRKNLGFHTQKGHGESVTIDLGAIRSVRSVEIFNRFDCCQNRALPLRLEASTDGVTYELIGRQRETFTFWKVALPSKLVRFLRLTDEGTNFFHLAEVEVY
jgi:hypothetical protein